MNSRNWFNTRLAKAILLIGVLIMNVLFYTWGSPESGAKYALDIHWLFLTMIQALFLYAVVGLSYFIITNK
jgi:hypothetical protein